jgi:hypothetical protein
VSHSDIKNIVVSARKKGLPTRGGASQKPITPLDTLLIKNCQRL